MEDPEGSTTPSIRSPSRIVPEWIPPAAVGVQFALGGNIRGAIINLFATESVARGALRVAQRPFHCRVHAS